ncbi:NADP-dependent phosphogluconate dehydrogenase [Echinicola jeungdonensis]|uniref:6-phosphogluconate dehydrogenase, decarboxylating n=1 Tax=Echinicola jeungdonensis TaxID=709343 RepID=A0ABV5J1E5_9BACT|nr:NADP-dependent phosphogluconate dehydrogenase [Echinicola jeungdonensis]MDN3668480.1 NADP-dependent phosphogluconate dehydrogenase [Echinicola jeungdonensis]
MEQHKKQSTLSSFGIIGMGVMGKSLAINLAGHGVKLSIYNRHVEGEEEKVAQKAVEENPELKSVKAFDQLADFVESLEQPRKILMMIPAGQIIDQQIARLETFLDKGDVIIDGGNSHYKDSTKRQKYLENEGILYVSMGVSGGEEGARKGPSLMPGGAKEGFDLVQPFLEKIAAKDKQGRPCMHYVGQEGSGHFVKMVHNSIEYAEMQLLAETYNLMRYYLQLSPEAISQEWKKWEKSGSGSFLLKISQNILTFKEDGDFLLDHILDLAAQKGIGGWAVNEAMDFHVPYSPLAEAVMARLISSQKDKRIHLEKVFKKSPFKVPEDPKPILENLKIAYDLVRMINHDVGFELIREAGEQKQWSLDLSEIARTWSSGSIIQSPLMEELVNVFASNSDILTSPKMEPLIKNSRKVLAIVVGEGLMAGMALPVMSSALNYILSMTTADSPANLIQAQRDYFGGHGYQRIGKSREKFFHTQWKAGKKE